MTTTHNNVSNNLELFYKFSERLVPHPNKAQILIEVDSRNNNLEKSLNILKSNNIEPARYEILRDGNPSWVLIYIPPEDMREAVFNLTEAGFIKLVGIDPSVRKQDL